MKPRAHTHAGSDRPDSKKSALVLRYFRRIQPIAMTNAK